MLCTDKGSMVQAQYCSEWTELWNGTHVRFFFLWDEPTRVVRVYYPLRVFIIDWLLMFVNQTQVGADLRYLCCNASHFIPNITQVFSVVLECITYGCCAHSRVCIYWKQTKTTMIIMQFIMIIFLFCFVFFFFQ